MQLTKISLLGPLVSPLGSNRTSSVRIDRVGPLTLSHAFEPPRNALSIHPKGSVDSFLLLQIASVLDLETGRLHRYVVSGGMRPLPLTLSCA
jgi:hypothetical protein